MFSKRISFIIARIPELINLLLIVSSAIFLAKIIWWFFSPNTVEVFIEKSSYNQYEASAKYISNRYPFGIFTIKESIVSANSQVKAAPPIASKVKLTGIYFSSPKASFAIVDYDKKSLLVKIGEQVGDNSSAIVSNILEHSIEITQDGNVAVINLLIEDNKANTNQTNNQNNNDTNSRGRFNRHNRVDDSNANSLTPPAPDNMQNDINNKKQQVINELSQTSDNQNSNNTNASAPIVK